VTVTGGLSGDGPRFQETLVLWNGAPAPRTIAAVGFYGPRLRIGYASLGGWDPFGPERLITRSEGNVLYELDGRSALDLYKTYLGPHASDLPASGLLFPLSIRTEIGDTPVVRTILSVDENDQSMTFAGDLPVGSYARFMKANFDRLIDGAIGAARTSHAAVGASSPGFPPDWRSWSAAWGASWCSDSGWRRRSKGSARCWESAPSWPVSTPTARSLPSPRPPAASCTTRP
jgi:hypothetical protein